MRRLLLLILLTVGVNAESFDIGTNTLGPAPGRRNGLAVAASASGFAAAWADARSGLSELMLARMDAAGRVLDVEGVTPPSRVALAGEQPVVIASDGSDYLVVATAHVPEVFYGGDLVVVRVSATSIGAPQPLGVRGKLTALAWNGTHYVLSYAASNQGGTVVLLDREGRIASGSFLFPGYAIQLACRSEECLVATSFHEARGAFLRSADFPELGTQRTLELSYLHPGGYPFFVGVDPNGFYTVTLGGGAKVRHLDGVFGRRVPPNGDLTGAKRFGIELLEEFTVPNFYYATATFADASGIYLSTGFGETPLWRLTPHGAEPIRATAGFNRQVAAMAGNPMRVFWSEAGGGSQFYNHDQTLLTTGRAREWMPRLARGNTTLLASWVETRAEDRDILYVCALDLDGRPISEPVVIREPETSSEDSIMTDTQIAFDGVNFLVAWRQHATFGDRPRLHGRLVSQTGAVAGDEFPLDGYIAINTLVWDGSAYVYSSDAGNVQRLTPGGVRLQSWEDWYGDVDAVALARDESTGTWSGLSVHYFHSRIAVGPWYFADFTPVTVRDPFQFDKAVKLGEVNTSPYFTVPPPSVAAGGGTFFAIVEDLEGVAYDGLTWKPIPYELTIGGRAEVRWDGGGYLVAGSRDLARFTPAKELRSTQSLGAGVEQSSVVPDGNAAVALVQRGRVPYRDFGTIEQIEAFRVTFPEQAPK